MTYPHRLSTLCLLFLACTANYSHAADDTPPMPRDQVLVTGKTVKVTTNDFDQEMKNIPEDKRIEFISLSQTDILEENS